MKKNEKRGKKGLVVKSDSLWEEQKFTFLAVSPALSFSVSLPVLTAKLIINECGFC